MPCSHEPLVAKHSIPLISVFHNTLEPTRTMHIPCICNAVGLIYSPLRSHDTMMWQKMSKPPVQWLLCAVRNEAGIRSGKLDLHSRHAFSYLSQIRTCQRSYHSVKEASKALVQRHLCSMASVCCRGWYLALGGTPVNHYDCCCYCCYHCC